MDIIAILPIGENVSMGITSCIDAVSDLTHTARRVYVCLHSYAIVYVYL